jgi:ABC-2 type transport system permease protein
MNDTRSIRSFFRIIWAIARKDIVDAVKNKTVLTVLGSVAFTVAMYKFLPYLDRGEELPNLLLYDAGGSDLAAQLEESPQLRLYVYDRREQMQRAVTRADDLDLGLVFPADLDRRLEAGETVKLNGYAAYWIDEAEIKALRQVVEDELSFYVGSVGVSGASVEIKTEMKRLYPMDPTTPGSGFMVSVAIVLVLTMLGALVVVHLMIEEKQTQTLDALMVSPASPLQMLLGKAVTGLVYCMFGVVAVYLLNAAYIVRWDLALFAGACGALFTVGLGLLLGTVFDSRQQLTLWGFLLMNLLLLPMFLVIMDDVLPASAVTVMHWVPTAVIAWLVRASFLPRPPGGQVLLRLAYVLAWAAAIYALGAWRVRRLER